MPGGGHISSRSPINPVCVCGSYLFKVTHWPCGGVIPVQGHPLARWGGSYLFKVTHWPCVCGRERVRPVQGHPLAGSGRSAQDHLAAMRGWCQICSQSPRRGHETELSTWDSWALFFPHSPSMQGLGGHAG